MLQGCTSCGLTDQVKSIRQILGIRNESQFTEVRGAILQPGEAQVQPVFGYTQINPDPNLAALQRRLTEYTAVPWRPSPQVTAMYRSYIRVAAGASILTAIGIVTIIFFGLGLIPLFFGIKLWRQKNSKYSVYLSAWQEEKDTFLFSNPEYLRKINGWYCQRCGVVFGDQ